MPRLMNGIVPLEFLVAPEVTHVLFERMNYQGPHLYRWAPVAEGPGADFDRLFYRSMA
jgi:hypothetical protein